MHRKVPLPRGWNRHAKSAILHTLALSHYTFPALIARAAKLLKRQQMRDTSLTAVVDHNGVLTESRAIEFSLDFCRKRMRRSRTTRDVGREQFTAAKEH